MTTQQHSPSSAQGSLDSKVNIVFERFTELTQEIQLPDARAPHAVAVAWTGGKDSTLALFLWRAFLQHFAPNAPLVCMNLDTGCKFPEILAFRDQLTRQWGVTLHVATPEAHSLDATRIGDDPGACCETLKIRPLQKAIRELGVKALITGVRADEHSSRADRQWLERRSAPTYIQLNPILEFTEADVWAFHMQHGLPYCSLYDQGYRSLGCRPCTAPPEEHTSERAARNQNKEKLLEQLTSLGYF